MAHDATKLAGLAKGTVAAMECCYGAELYDPALAAGQPGICNTYLGLGAHGYFGSSTIAYGPASGNGQADLICQFFLQHVLSGASTGEAALRARIDFIALLSVADPTDLKTIAQFNLMGDPSLHPVAMAPADDVKLLSGGSSKSKAKAAPGAAALRAASRPMRRRHLAALGESVGSAGRARRYPQGLEAAERRQGLSRARAAQRRRAQARGLLVRRAQARVAQDAGQGAPAGGAARRRRRGRIAAPQGAFPPLRGRGGPGDRNGNDRASRVQSIAIGGAPRYGASGSRSRPARRASATAVVLVTPKREYVLRIQGGHAFSDPRLDSTRRPAHPRRRRSERRHVPAADVDDGIASPGGGL